MIGLVLIFFYTYTNIFNAFRFWVKCRCFLKIFEASVLKLFKAEMLDTDILHGDGTCTAAKNVIAPFVTAPGNRHKTILLAPAISSLKKIAMLVGLDIKKSIMSLDGAYNSHSNRKAIFNLGMTPNAPENKGNRKKSKRGKKQTFCKKKFRGRFRTIERVLLGRTSLNVCCLDSSSTV